MTLRAGTRDRSAHDPGAVTHADRGRLASPPVVEHIAHCRVRERAKSPRVEQLPGAQGEDPVALRHRDGDEPIEPGRLGSYRLHLGGADPGWLPYEEGTALPL
jgi:hypothetical protein